MMHEIVTDMSLSDAVDKIAHLKGQRKLGEYCGGAMIPRGYMSTAEILATVFGVDKDNLEKVLEDAIEKAYDNAWGKHVAKFREGK